jgi:hypothetical protein
MYHGPMSLLANWQAPIWFDSSLDISEDYISLVVCKSLSNALELFLEALVCRVHGKGSTF